MQCPSVTPRFLPCPPKETRQYLVWEKDGEEEQPGKQTMFARSSSGPLRVVTTRKTEDDPRSERARSERRGEKQERREKQVPLVVRVHPTPAQAALQLRRTQLPRLGFQGHQFTAILE